MLSFQNPIVPDGSTIEKITFVLKIIHIFRIKYAYSKLLGRYTWLFISSIIKKVYGSSKVMNSYIDFFKNIFGSL